MLNANATSKAKLPIVAMSGEPRSIFPETQGGGNRNQERQERRADWRKDGARALGRQFARRWDRRRGGEAVNVFSGSGGRGSAARRSQVAGSKRSAGGSAGEFPAQPPSSLRLRGRVQIRGARKAGRRGDGFHSPD